MTAYGLTPVGFVPKTLGVLIDEMSADLRRDIDQNLDLDPETSFEGRRLQIFANKLAELWEVAQAVDSSRDPDKAVDAALDAVTVLTGTVRLKSKRSTAVLTCTGTPGTLLGIGRAASSAGSPKFITDADATIAALAVWAAATFAAGARVTNGGTAYQCTTAGTSVTGPTGTGTGIADGGTARWRSLGEGTGAVDAPASASVAGPLTAVSGTVTTIETPVSGWSGVINLADAVPGHLRETNPALRLRRYEELSELDGAAFEALRDAVLALEGVTTCRVFVNTTDATDGDGIPPHGVEVLVQGGDDDEIRAAIFAHVSTGIPTYGNTSGTVTDSQNESVTILFTRPTLKPIYVAVTLIKDPATYPSDGDAQVKAAIAAYGNLSVCGKDAVARALAGSAFPFTSDGLLVRGVLGVLDVPTCAIGLSSSPTLETTIPIALRELATYDTSRITVSASDGTP